MAIWFLLEGTLIYYEDLRRELAAVALSQSYLHEAPLDNLYDV
ncbi:MAG: hypothetical protein QGI95_00955 [Dehalococcoidales bacterium]|nr:hypothetical protein [Dehalococcoidales bacterium]MDP6824684.1 hypothetical protein [Dehalococcoidales bacterium]